MKTYKFKGLLTKNGWLESAYVQVDDQGIIQEIGQKRVSDFESVDAYALPGFQNAHSHAFQYAMAGLAERHKASAMADDFWSWREAMYQLALSMNPDQMEAIASMLYAEMLRQGYTEVAEFHYLHHDKDGKPYGNLAEMGERLLAAAQKTGIKISLIPVFYRYGGFGKAANERQRRFLSQDLEAYLKLFDESRSASRNYQHARVGYAAHSMRAVATSDLKMLCQVRQPEFPLHMHIAEQKQEIKECIQTLKARPVEWILDNLNLGPNFHLVHSTHMSRDESRALGESGAHVVLCPSTEGNLGDGLFPLHSFQEHGGKWSIGTDSHIGLNPFEELRILDYGQRIHSHNRNSFIGTEAGDNGEKALEMAFFAGKKAMGKEVEDFFEVGEALDALLIDPDAPLIASSSLENLTSSIVYTSDASMHKGTLLNGEWKVRDGKHIDHSSITKDFAKAIKALGNR
ncbi:MAG: formimidoylglutamate deiminase [Bacteroidia bacterium]|nr:formimidoylglutamate deiminase [Bacteroidia bacterium]